MQVMLQEMERRYRKRPIIYTTLDFYEANLSNGALTDYPIWVRSTEHHPAVKYGSRAWHFWQYQSDGRVPGIGGDVDKDAFYGSHLIARQRTTSELEAGAQDQHRVGRVRA